MKKGLSKFIVLDIFSKKSVPDLQELKRIQEKVASLVVRGDEITELSTVGGCDVSFAVEDKAYAACAILDYKTLSVLRTKVVKVRVTFPYIPTFLAFRELEPMLKAVEGMDASVYIIGAQGILHPRRAGLASHLGVILDKPTIGVAKSPLCGKVEEPEDKDGAIGWVRDGEEIIGAAVRISKGRKPLYVSIGHKVSLETAIRLTLETTRSTLPEPLLIAHRLATKAAKDER